MLNFEEIKNKEIIKGGFGNIYLYKVIVIHQKEGIEETEETDIVTKVEKNRNTSINEHNIYKNIITQENIKLWAIEKDITLYLPKIIDMGILKSNNSSFRYLTMPNYGINLYEYLKEIPRTLKLEEILGVYHNILNSLEFLHSHKIIHNDLKLSNIMIKNSNFNEVVLIDYGLCSYNNKCFELFLGNLLFSSYNAHKSVSLTYIDDIISLSYIIFYLFYRKIPWKGIIDKDKILDKKIKFKQKYYQYNFHPFIKELFDYIYNLNKYDKINYKILRNLRIKN